jgi:tRNA (guanine37-N1)-methyltransferase
LLGLGKHHLPGSLDHTGPIPRLPALCFPFSCTHAPMNLRQTLHSRLPNLDPTRLPGGFDRIGDIAVVSITPEVAAWEGEIGRFILEHHPTLRVVAKRDGHYGGEYRTRPLRVLAGDDRLTTVHRENGITLHLDLARVYFSVRLAHERARIAALVQPGERVAVLCSGVGPYPLIIGLHSRAREVLGIEKNPEAHAYALYNLKVNRRITSVRFLEGDAGLALAGCPPRFDRVLIVLPHGGEPLLPCALATLKPGGHLHLYAMQAKGCPDGALRTVEAICRRQERRAELRSVISCGHCGPDLYRVCLDLVIDPVR